MDAATTKNRRTGKYCPRCQTMAVLERPVCTHCGHHFRTGHTEAMPDAPRPEADPLNRTRQFTIPLQFARQAPPAETSAEPRSSAKHRRGLLLAATLLFLAVPVGLFYWHRPAAKASPVGEWETTLASRAAQNARLEFDFGQDGSGSFSWNTQRGLAHRGQIPLHWRLDPSGKLIMTLTPPPQADAFSGTFVTIFSGHPWLWREAADRRQLVIGTLALREKAKELGK